MTGYAIATGFFVAGVVPFIFLCVYIYKLLHSKSKTRIKMLNLIALSPFVILTGIISFLFLQGVLE